MKWPQLVKPWACKVPITITLTDGIGEDGAPPNCRHSGSAVQHQWQGRLDSG